ncbi:hypothetical protein [Legionella fallonii]|uniref:Uncharacterized protein n=1 Tax=Legionella fallonii LLAP-10 TaxID=1212491 RepID=A0A098G473_9GAMM|nr:hypothetical protein [Legionella fallonii]CEG57288.1 protein of unknown function [coiled-coil domain] [Legionella fallonii LLAP-10]
MTDNQEHPIDMFQQFLDRNVHCFSKYMVFFQGTYIDLVNAQFGDSNRVILPEQGICDGLTTLWLHDLYNTMGDFNYNLSLMGPLTDLDSSQKSSIIQEDNKNNLAPSIAKFISALQSSQYRRYVYLSDNITPGQLDFGLFIFKKNKRDLPLEVLDINQAAKDEYFDKFFLKHQSSCDRIYTKTNERCRTRLKQLEDVFEEIQNHIDAKIDFCISMSLIFGVNLIAPDGDEPQIMQHVIGIRAYKNDKNQIIGYQIFDSCLGQIYFCDEKNSWNNVTEFLKNLFDLYCMELYSDFECSKSRYAKSEINFMQFFFLETNTVNARQKLLNEYDIYATKLRRPALLPLANYLHTHHSSVKTNAEDNYLPLSEPTSPKSFNLLKSDNKKSNDYPSFFSKNDKRYENTFPDVEFIHQSCEP